MTREPALGRDKTRRMGTYLMRQTISTVPMDGKFLILEDDATGAREVARWSTKEGGWVGEDGEPSKITPTHWHPVSVDEDRWRPSEKAQAPRARLASV